MRKITLMLLSFIVLALPISVNAISFQSGDTLTLPADKTYNETVVIAAKNLVINSPINGDLYCAGSNVVINAPIAGDVICAAETLKISGKFTGNLRAAARTLDVDADVHSTATLASQDMTLGSNTLIGGDLFAAASMASISGKISRDIALASPDLNFSANGLRNAYIYTNNPKFDQNTAKIGGNLDLYTPQNVQVNPPEGLVVGQLNRHQVETPSTEVKDKAAAAASPKSWITSKLISIISFLLVGLLLLHFTATRTLAAANTVVARPFASLFGGFAILLFTPIFFILALISIIGIPAAFIILLVYIIGLIISSVISSVTLGKLVLTKFVADSKFHTRYYYLLVGLPLLWLLFAIPGFGWLLTFISLCLGLGAYFLSFLPAKVETK